MKNKKGFTLIELLIVIGIISIIMLLGSTVYSGVQKKSRDAKRKGDLNVIRSSLELYRTNFSYYPASLNENEFSSNYLKIDPSDPNPSQDYNYTAPICSSGLRCDYTLGAKLELSNAATCLAGCGNVSCNFCLGPNGEK